MQTLRRFGGDNFPDCIAFLAASVLAAYQMRSDEEAAATAQLNADGGLGDDTILGTQLGNWAWDVRDFTGWVSIGNPPSGAAGGYGWFVLVALD